MAQWVKDLALSLQWLGSLLWRRELPHATGVAKKEKERKKKEKKNNWLADPTFKRKDYDLKKKHSSALSYPSSISSPFQEQTFMEC